MMMAVSDARPPFARPSGFSEADFEEEITSVTSLPALPGRAEAAVAPVRDRATLTLLSGPSAGAIHSLLLEINVIGRGKECTIRVDDPGISRNHARIVRQGPGSYLVEDLDSRNGTFVNGQRMARQELSEGDRVGLGHAVELRFGFTDVDEEARLRRLYESSVQDGLTGAFNRKHFNERIHGEIAYARRHKTALSLILFDLDHFKRINDSLGHLGGDHVLRSVASLVRRTLRAEDVFARYGGEEFAIIARGIDVGRAFMFAERIRATVLGARFEFNRTNVPVTISLGVASLECCGDAQANEALVEKADERLYAAKRGGRNRTVGRSAEGQSTAPSSDNT
jgi:diguanylate cyclase (GGDEF)-like protein